VSRQPALIAAVLLLFVIFAGAEDLLQELKRRSATEGLALVHWNGIPVRVISFDREPQAIRDTPYLSSAWLSSNGDVVAWSHSRTEWSGSPPLSCATPLIVESPGASWQLPGSAMNFKALGVSADGRRVSFDATYKPPGTGVLNTSENRAHWISGLFYADSTKEAVTLISQSCGTTSISWSPAGNSFVYDCQDHLLIYDVPTAKSLALAPGSTPSWSPDGRRIAFRSTSGRATALDPTTMKIKPIMDGRKIEWGVHWSPDSRYVMAAQRVGFLESLFRGGFSLDVDQPRKIVIYRLEDGTSSDRSWFPAFGENDRGYYWVSDYRAFLRSAMLPPTVKPCP
jgi:hypothetical protein